MRKGVVLALCLSLVFIATATWMRIGSRPTVVASLTSVEKDAALEEIYSFENIAVDQILGTNTPERLTNTDLISRQLILDYVDLEANGRAAETSILSLAEKYTSNIATLGSITSIDISNITIVSDSTAAFQQYEESINQVHKEFADKMNASYNGGRNLSTNNSAFYSFAGMLGSEYFNAANKLRNLPVPQSVASAHVELANSYFSSAAAMEALSRTEEDPAVAFAGIETMNSNMEKENNILTKISGILMSNGI